MSNRFSAGLLVAVAILVLTVIAGCADSRDQSERGSPEDEAPTQSTEVDDLGPELDPDSSTTDQPSSSDAGQPAPLPPAQPADWTDCDDGLECATVAVPVDYLRPDGAQLDISLVRVPADGSAKGSIFVNPGGPGGSGVDFVRLGFRLDGQTGRDYHLVGFDPRGVGESNPLACEANRGDAALPDLSPDDPAEESILDDEALAIVEQCQSRDTALLPHLTTENVARDLDRLRQAVGDEQLHYYGLSYGTALGLWYAQLFPEAVGHMVLDGVVDPGLGLPGLLRQQAAAFERQFELLDQRCGTSSRACSPSDDLSATYDRLSDRLEAGGPVDEVGASELAVAALLPIYYPSTFGSYVEALNRADGGDVSAIGRLSAFFLDSIPFTAYAAYSCSDSEHPVGGDEWAAFARELDEQAPRFGALVANELRVCAYWPPAEGGPDPAGYDPSELAQIQATVLVVGNTGDAATPLENAEIVAAQLGSAHLVTVDADRHTAYNGSSCVRALVSDYFADELGGTQSFCSTDDDD